MSEINKWAAELLAANPLILDTETTGLSPTAEPVSIAIIDSAGQTLFDSLIRPAKAAIESGAQKVHGISARRLADAPTLADVHDQLKVIMAGRVIAVYNAPYDKAIIATGCQANNIPSLTPLAATWEDVMEPYARHWGDWSSWHGNYRWQRLTDACRQQSIHIENAHAALGDCLMTLALIKKLAEGVIRT